MYIVYVIRKLNFVYLNLYLDTFLLRPKMPFGQRKKWHVGSNGERGCQSQRRQHTIEKFNNKCKIFSFEIYGGINCTNI